MTNNQPFGQAGSSRGRRFSGKFSAGPGGTHGQQAMNSIGNTIYEVRLEKDERKHLVAHSRRYWTAARAPKNAAARRTFCFCLTRAALTVTSATRRSPMLLRSGPQRQSRCASVMEGLEAALDRKVQVNRKKRLLDGDGEARLTMLASSKPPHGRNTETLPQNPSTGVPERGRPHQAEVTVSLNSLMSRYWPG